MTDLTTLTGYRDRLRAARYRGARRLRDANGEEIEFKSDSEMVSALRALESDIAAAQSRPASTIKFQTSKGL